MQPDTPSASLCPDAHACVLLSSLSPRFALLGRVRMSSPTALTRFTLERLLCRGSAAYNSRTRARTRAYRPAIGAAQVFHASDTVSPGHFSTFAHRSDIFHPTEESSFSRELVMVPRDGNGFRIVSPRGTRRFSGKRADIDASSPRISRRGKSRRETCGRDISRCGKKRLCEWSVCRGEVVDTGLTAGRTFIRCRGWQEIMPDRISVIEKVVARMNC